MKSKHNNYFLLLIKTCIQLLYNLVIGIICFLIYIFTYEPNKKHILTIRKAKRIRVLTKFKLWYFNHFKHLTIFLGDYDYFKYLDKHLNKKE